MKISLSELDCASRDCLAPLEVGHLADAARVVVGTNSPDPELTFGEAGLAIHMHVPHHPTLGQGRL